MAGPGIRTTRVGATQSWCHAARCESRDLAGQPPRLSATPPRRYRFLGRASGRCASAGKCHAARVIGWRHRHAVATPTRSIDARQRHLLDAQADHLELLRGRLAQVDDAAGRIRTAIVHAHQHLTAIDQLRTHRRVPKGKVLRAAVKLPMSKRSPLAVLR